jgi:hypothetical protein
MDPRRFICRCSGVVIAIAGGLAFMAACSTILFGGLFGATRILENGAEIVYRGWGGIAFSLLTLALALLSFYRPRRAFYAGVGIAAVIGALIGGYLVALFLAPAALAGFLAAACAGAKDAPQAMG